MSGWMGSVSYGLRADWSLPPCLSVTIDLNIFVGIKMNCVGSSEHKTSYTRASFLNMRADQSSSWLIRIDHFVTILPYFSLCKMPENGNTSPLFKILFFKNICIYFRLIFFCNVQIKDSSIVDIENRWFDLLLLPLIWARDWLQQKVLYLILMHFID